MFLSADACVTIDWFPLETDRQMVAAGLVKDWTMAMVRHQVVPTLKRGRRDRRADRDDAGLQPAALADRQLAAGRAPATS